MHIPYPYVLPESNRYTLGKSRTARMRRNTMPFELMTKSLVLYASLTRVRTGENYIIKLLWAIRDAKRLKTLT